ncbi:MAG: hypothetical protein AB8B80_02310 [Marinicellaceae bacterium]
MQTSNLSKNRIVKGMKFLYTMMLPLSLAFILMKDSLFSDYPFLINIYLLTYIVFFVLQIPYAVYYRYQYNRESEQRKMQFIKTNRI